MTEAICATSFAALEAGVTASNGEIQLIRELLQRVPDIHVSGLPEKLLSGFIHGIKRMPVEWTPVG